MGNSSRGYGKLIDDIVYGTNTCEFGPAQWVQLALAALDQAGVSPARLADAYRHGMRKNGGTVAVLDELDLLDEAPVLGSTPVVPPRKVVTVGWDGASQPMYRFYDEMPLPDHMRARPTPEQIRAWKTWWETER